MTGLPSLPPELARVDNVVKHIAAGYAVYLEEFNRVTALAPEHFERADFHAIQADTKARLSLYKDTVLRIAGEVGEMLGKHVTDPVMWTRAREAYAQEIRDRKDYEIAETFFNSVLRKLPLKDHYPFLFIVPRHSHTPQRSTYPIFEKYSFKDGLVAALRTMMADYPFRLPFEDAESDLQKVADRLHRVVFGGRPPERHARLEMLRSVFYRNKCAYLVGRVHQGREYVPLALPILHSPRGYFLDAALTDPNDLSILFSFTRSYFLVDVEIPAEMVNFLKTIMPQKSVAELYNSIGFNKHGKTELYRDFLMHLHDSEDLFVEAPGIKGMVMLVFTLPSYQIVFKLIKDKFDPVKNITREQVKAKYKLVSQHDRVGRMADTHEFAEFRIPKDRISPQLLEALSRECGSILDFKGDSIIIKHLYTERKMIPLNLYLEHASSDEAEQAVNEYGNAIKQLAAANIFPGDMLLKNFGVTRHGRIIFYDYDEILFLTDCNFRTIPEPRDPWDEMASEAWFAVGPNDIFPEEFTKFLIGRSEIRELFYRIHADIFEASFWREMQRRIREGEIVTVFPYRRHKRFAPQRESL